LTVRDIMPEGEDLRRAIRWISGKRQDSPDGPVMPFINEAIFKFDISPKDAHFLIDFFTEGKEEM
jgi:hypothetical protein